MKCLSLKSSRARVANNERGQVGIFVALIFQVIFVFFAMLINVGLVVHHKINLQQSTDLAAYYGAMKQAEILNAMAHVNFQMRQAWKLLTWRYRILGTFGLEQKGGGTEIEYPILWRNPAKKPTYNPLSETFKCPSTLANAGNLTVSDVPFSCMGHVGFADYKTSDNSETFCKMNCGHMDMSESTTISPIIGVGSANILGATQGGAINAAIDKTNQNLKQVCESLAPITMTMLSLYYGNYLNDVQNKSSFIKMLRNNLLLDENDILDLDGKKIITGTKNTFENNLTEANKSGLIKFETFNGIKASNNTNGDNKEFLQEIAFQYLQFFIVRCDVNNATDPKNISVGSLYNAGALRPQLKAQANSYDAGLGDRIEDIFNNNDDKHNILGFEKNPWYQIYYGVKASAEPKIPFLPIAKIKLNAISFAKPFGGSIGPWYVNNWDYSAKTSFEGDPNYQHRTDPNLPRLKVINDPSLNNLKGARETIVNYSNFVGDNYSNQKGDGLKGGLANNQIVAIYNTMLANKYVPVVTTNASTNKIAEPVATSKVYIKPSVFPRYVEWSHLTKPLDDPDYDAMALNINGPNVDNSYMRDIEMTVVAPNQFDLTYYSIDPNFHETYFVEKMDKNSAFANIQNATGMSGNKIIFPKDFGYNEKLIAKNSIPKNFSVRHQLQVVHDIFKKNVNDILKINPVIDTNDKDSSGRSYFFTYIPKFQSSLLTGWTFNDFKDFTTFPSPNNDKSKYTMQFGTCADPWMKDNGGNPAYDSPNTDGSGKPTVPGNCVTGGRTGYSVKIISNDMVRAGKQQKDVGGPGKNGEIKNPVPDSFLSF